MVRPKSLKTVNLIELYELALQGLLRRREEVARRIDDLRNELDGRSALTRKFEEVRPKRHLTAKGMRAIQAAQARRWNTYHAIQRRKTQRG